MRSPLAIQDCVLIGWYQTTIGDDVAAILYCCGDGPRGTQSISTHTARGWQSTLCSVSTPASWTSRTFRSNLTTTTSLPPDQFLTQEGRYGLEWPATWRFPRLVFPGYGVQTATLGHLLNLLEPCGRGSRRPPAKRRYMGFTDADSGNLQTAHVPARFLGQVHLTTSEQ